MGFSHINEEGRAKMVDVGDKEVSKRKAVARGKIKLSPYALEQIKAQKIKKGDVLAVAQVGGVMAAKKTSEIIPMCHNIFLTGVDISFAFLSDGIEITAEVSAEAKTGVEMEALTAVSASALTIYDMVKSVDKDMVIEHITLLKKEGGKAGLYVKKL